MDENFPENQIYPRVEDIVYHPLIQNDKDIVEEVGENDYKLQLNYRALKKLPQCINQFRHLKILSLKYNLLDSLPEQIGLLINLEKINIGHNMLTYLPRNLRNLKKLTTLKAKHNFINEIPVEIAHLENLTVLKLSYNRLQSLPVTLKFCKNLKILTLKRNLLEEIPNNLVFLPNLKIFIISHNRISYLPSLVFQKLRHFSNDNEFNEDNQFYEKIEFIYDNDNGFINVDSSNNFINYISYDCFQAVGFEYAEWYRFTDNKKFENRIKVSDHILEVDHDGKTKHLILDRMLKNVYNMNEELFPTLKEITLRLLFNTTSDESLFKIYFLDEEIPIPSDMFDLLMKGPISKCVLCNNLIFMEAVVWILKKTYYWSYPPEARGEQYLVAAYFCSSSCAAIYQQSQSQNVENYNLSRLEWKKVDGRRLSRKRVRICDLLKRAAKKTKFLANEY